MRSSYISLTKKQKNKKSIDNELRSSSASGEWDTVSGLLTILSIFCREIAGNGRLAAESIDIRSNSSRRDVKFELAEGFNHAGVIDEDRRHNLDIS